MMKQILPKFRNRGIALTTDARDRLDACLKDFAQSDRVEVATSIIDKIDISKLQDGKLDLAYLEKVIEAMSSENVNSAIPSNLFVNCVNTLDIPKYVYNSTTKTFDDRVANKTLFGVSEDKAYMFRHRYEITKQRVLRNPLFASAARGMDVEGSQLATIETLRGTKGSCVLLGFLLQLDEGKYYLEDLSAQIPLNFVALKTKIGQADADLKAHYGFGLFTEGSLVLVKGEAKSSSTSINGEFHVESLFMPPPEDAQETFQTYSGIDFFGGQIPAKLQGQLLEWEKANFETSIYIFSDLLLDNPKSLGRLKILFLRLSETDPAYRPSIILFIGNFTSYELGQATGDIETIQGLYKTFADLIASYKEINNNTLFIFIPGPLDAPLPVFPLSPIPSFYRKPLEDKLEHVVFATNPCHLRIGTKMIVIQRDDSVNNMRRKCLFPPFPSPDVELHEHYINTIAAQGHLNPLADKTISWNQDHCLRLYPLPDAVILADSYQCYHTELNSCKFFNPGSFNIDSSFILYKPLTHSDEQVQICQID